MPKYISDEPSGMQIWGFLKILPHTSEWAHCMVPCNSWFCRMGVSTASNVKLTHLIRFHIMYAQGCNICQWDKPFLDILLWIVRTEFKFHVRVPQFLYYELFFIWILQRKEFAVGRQMYRLTSVTLFSKSYLLLKKRVNIWPSLIPLSGKHLKPVHLLEDTVNFLNQYKYLEHRVTPNFMCTLITVLNH